MIQYIRQYELLKKTCKSWENITTDELIYSFYNVNTEKGTAFVGYDEAVAMNFRGRWWEILIQHRNGDFYCVIIEPNFLHTRTHIKSQTLPAESDSTMLVVIREFMQNPQAVHSWISCRVWLKRIDNITSIFGDIMKESLHFAQSPFAIAMENGKGCLVRRILGCEQRQLPDEVIKSGAEVMEDIAYNNANAPRNSIKLKGVDISRIVRIGLSVTSERVSVLPSADSIIERLYVIRRPIELQP